jgi:hypothetical protein
MITLNEFEQFADTFLNLIDSLGEHTIAITIGATEGVVIHLYNENDETLGSLQLCQGALEELASDNVQRDPGDSGVIEEVSE